MDKNLRPVLSTSFTTIVTQIEYSSYLCGQQKESVMNGIKYDCIIIGGGISGISFAHYLHTLGKRALILEQKNRTGGQIQTICSELNPDYWRELGSHTCYNSYTHLLSVLKDIGSSGIVRQLRKGSYVVYSEGKIKKILSEMSFLPMMLNCLKIFFISKSGKTVKEYFSKIVGKKNYDRLFSRLFRAVICQDANDYPAQLFLKHRKDRFKGFPRKFTFTRGMSSIIDEVVAKDKLDIGTNSKVTGLEYIREEGNNSHYKINTDGGATFFADTVALATDPHTASALLKGVNRPVSDLLATIPLFASESMNVVIPKDKLSMDVVAGIIPVSDEFMSAVSRDLVEDRAFRSFTFHFRKGEKNQGEKKELICRVLGVSENDILESVHISHILPSMRIEHLDMAAQVDKLRVEDSLFILGNYFYGLSLEDCVHRSSDEFERYKNIHSV